MWTKNGNVRPGTEARIVSLSAAKAGVASATAIRLATTIRRVIRMDISSQFRVSGFPEIGLNERAPFEGRDRRQHSSETADMSPGAVRAHQELKALSVIASKAKRSRLGFPAAA